MYAIKPWGKACHVGLSVGTLTLGIGMRWRETITEMVDSRRDPTFEMSQHQRCVLSEHHVRLLQDVGVTRSILLQALRPARRWRFLTPDLEVMKEGEAYTGCSPSEPVYHVSRGRLLQVLRREYQRFGGTISWDTQAIEPTPGQEATGLWSLKKDWGSGVELECIVTSDPLFESARRIILQPEHLHRGPLAGDQNSVELARGAYRGAIEPLDVMFDQHSVDYVMILGRGYVVHAWRSEKDHNGESITSWTMVSTQGTDDAKSDAVTDPTAPSRPISATKGGAGFADLHPALLSMMSKGRTTHDTHWLPSTCPALVPLTSGHGCPGCDTARVVLTEDALLTVDPFDWRGDQCSTAIEEAADLLQRFYKKKFHRGFVPLAGREFHEEALKRRWALCQRDGRDAANFLSVFAPLPKGTDTTTRLAGAAA